MPRNREVPTLDPIENVLQRLHGVTGGNGQWQARCPNPDHGKGRGDRSPSLSIGVATNGAVLLTCHAGCPIEQITGAINLTPRDLLVDNGRIGRATNRNKKGRRVYPDLDAAVSAQQRMLDGATAVERYTYTNDFRIVRFLPPSGDKTFRPISRNVRGWFLGDPPGPLPLYKISDIPANGTLYVVEGEKDCDDAWSLALPTVTSAHGSKSAHKSDWSTLQGRDVVIIADADKAGDHYAQSVAGLLHDLQCQVRVIDRLPGVPDGGSVSDFIAVHDSRETDELRRIILERAEAAPPWKPKDDATTRMDTPRMRFTQLWVAERLVADHHPDLRWCLHLGWMAFDGMRWQRDAIAEVERRAKDAVQDVFALAMSMDKEDSRRSDLIKFALQCERQSNIAGVIELARSELPLPVRLEAFDVDPWLLNVENGTLDLRTGKLCEHRREDLITKLAPVKYAEGAKCPRWDRFLVEIFDGNGELIDFVQRALGSALAGVIREHHLHILWGTGWNGKSTLIDTIAEVLGDHAKTAAPGLLLRQYGEQHPTQLADLHGARFVSSLETGEGRRLDEERVKWITGGDRIKGRYMKRDFFEFKPTHKLFLGTNHKPEIRGTDCAIWRRICLWPFTVQIPEAQRDLALKDKLRTEASGILSWLVKGCLRWQRDGMREPDVVKAATAQYQSDSDIVGSFLAECCVTEPVAQVGVTELFEVFEHWTERPISKQVFGNRLRERGLQPPMRGAQGKRFWRALGLKAESESSDAGDAGDGLFGLTPMRGEYKG